MKKAGHGSVPSNPTQKCKATFLTSLNNFFIRLCAKNMQTQETFKKKSALTVVPPVINYFLISTLLFFRKLHFSPFPVV